MKCQGGRREGEKLYWLGQGLFCFIPLLGIQLMDRNCPRNHQTWIKRHTLLIQVQLSLLIQPKTIPSIFSNVTKKKDPSLVFPTSPLSLLFFLLYTTLHPHYKIILHTLFHSHLIGEATNPINCFTAFCSSLEFESIKQLIKIN